MKKKYKNLLVGGCSFSSNGIGGSPPTINSAGGCSYIEDIDYETAHPGSWPGFLAQHLGVTSLVNTATSGHGNNLIANSLLEFINKFYYNSSDTLVVMNISEPGRLDLPCAHDHPDADNQHIPWDSSLISYSYFNRSSNIIKNMEKNIGFDQIEQLTSNSVEFLFTFLESRSIDFYFLTMTDFNNSCLINVLNKFDSHYIRLTPGPSMYEYCQQTKTYISKTDSHPNNLGHKQIADIIYEQISMSIL
jgi:hypothetical protein